MELVRIADRKGRRIDERAADEIFLSRRMLLFKGMFIAGFGGLIAKLGKMQMVDAHQYANQVQGNAQRFEVLNAPRGLIVDRNNNILAENRISWTVSLYPPDIPTDEGTLSYVRDQLTSTLGLKELLVVRRNGLPLGSEDYVLTALAKAIGDNPTDLITQVMYDTPDNLVAVRE
ncbi:MAG TPA: penicillin-binding protein 2, partial [Nitrolancea sp.]|nr:penicillin-binding protein 2 [Nitrolancea sp.]